jgi:hypothetical protein
MKNTSKSILGDGLLAVASLLLTSMAYLYAHRLLPPERALGAGTALWQIIVALLFVALAGGIGERVLGSCVVRGLVRFSLSTGLGLWILSTAILMVGALVGTNLVAFGGLAVICLLIACRAVPAWLSNTSELPGALAGKYTVAIAFAVGFILLMALAYALAPPMAFDSLVYHLAIPSAYLQQGHIRFQPDTMFWGMPQVTEMLYLAVMRFAGVGSATVLAVMIGAITLIGVLGFTRSIFSDSAAWTAVAALVGGEAIVSSLSSGYVDWLSMLFGWSAMTTLTLWFKAQDRRMLALCGLFCGAALGTKYSAGVILIACMVALVLFQERGHWRSTLLNIFWLGLAAAAASSPWWIKNALAVGNPFYPFFVPSGAMDRLRLDFYQKVPIWRDWQAVILLPWQATFLGIDGKEGFSASIGPLLVSLSTLAWINWPSKTADQKRAIQVAGIMTFTCFVLWAVASRISGFLVQTRLYFVFFPTWAVLAGAGMHAVQDLKVANLRFGLLVRALVLLMVALEVLSLAADFAARNPGLYVLRGEDSHSYLTRNLGPYSLAMQAIGDLPPRGRTLMLWETRGYYCLPQCDSDEVIDRWYHDATLHGSPDAIIKAWHDQGYTHLLVFDWGREYVQEHDYPQERTMHWSVLDATLRSLSIEKQIGEDAYTLYAIP